jgi:hypothetical protein
MMRIPRKTTRGAAWTMAVGAAAGVAAAALWTVRARGWPRRSRRMRGDLTLEDRVVNALLEDEATSRCAIEVAAISPGVIELTGSVGTPAELRRAVEVTQGVSGVTTVVNRLEVGMEASRMSERRRRYEEGDPALREQHWYGVGVGTGRRRQGASTDPDRRDDRVDMLTEAFEEQAAEVERAEDPDAEPQPGGGAPPVL